MLRQLQPDESCAAAKTESAGLLIRFSRSISRCSISSVSAAAALATRPGATAPGDRFALAAPGQTSLVTVEVAVEVKEVLYSV